VAGLGLAINARTLINRSNAQLWVLASLVVLIWFAFTLVDPNFANSVFVTYPLLRDAATFTVVGLAQMTALSIGHMNLAVGRMAAVAAMVAGISFQFFGASLLVGALLGIAAAALLGVLTGVIIVVSNVNSFIVTLAMDFLLVGFVALVYTRLTTAAAFTVKPDGMKYLGRASLADICAGPVCGPRFMPMLLIPALVIVGYMIWIYRRSRFGRELIAIGNSMRASAAAAIPTRRRVIQAHALSAALAGAAGIMVVISNGAATAAIGSEFMIPSFLGPLLGGTSLLGGAVSVIGTIFGTLLTFVLRSGLTTHGVGLEALNISLGVLLLLVLSVQSFSRIRGQMRMAKARMVRVRASAAGSRR